MKDLRDLKDLTIHDVKPRSDEWTTGRRYSLCNQTPGYSDLFKIRKLSWRVKAETSLGRVNGYPETDRHSSLGFAGGYGSRGVPTGIPRS